MKHCTKHDTDYNQETHCVNIMNVNTKTQKFSQLKGRKLAQRYVEF